MQQGLGLLSCSSAERGLCTLCTVYPMFLFTKPRGTGCPRVPYYDHLSVLCKFMVLHCVSMGKKESKFSISLFVEQKEIEPKGVARGHTVNSRGHFKTQMRISFL